MNVHLKKDKNLEPVLYWLNIVATGFLPYPTW